MATAHLNYALIKIGDDENIKENLKENILCLSLSQGFHSPLCKMNGVTQTKIKYPNFDRNY